MEEVESPRRARRRQRLELLLAEEGGAAQVARVSGTPKSHFSAMTSRKRGLGDELADKLEKLYNKPPGWFDLPITESSKANTEPANGSSGEVPLISWVAAGCWGEAVDNFAPGEADEWFPCVRKHSAQTYALRVKGDSMTAPHGNMRSYPAGCIIFVDPAKRAPVNGERIIAKLDGASEVTFKVFKEEDGRRWLQPLNPAHEPIRDAFKVLGTVIGKWEDE